MRPWLSVLARAKAGYVLLLWGRGRLTLGRLSTTVYLVRKYQASERARAAYSTIPYPSNYAASSGTVGRGPFLYPVDYVIFFRPP